MDQRETYRNTLQYALAIAGSELALAVRLRVTQAELTLWVDGREPVPDTVFLKAVDVIVRASPADIARSREAMHKASNGRQQHP